MRPLLAQTLVLLAAASCGGGGQGTAGSALATSNLRVLLTDSPVDGADAVYVVIDRVELIRNEGDEEVFVVVNDEDQEVELLALQNDVTAVIGEGTFPAGAYAGIRLILVGGKAGGGPPPRPVGDNRIVIGGETFRLTIASGAQTGLKLHNPFTIEEGRFTELLIDFNVRHSIVRLGRLDEYRLKPRLTLVESVLRGAIDGTVTDAGTTAPLAGAVLSAQQGGDEILSTLSGSDGGYRLAPLEPGTYDVVASAEGYAPALIEAVPVTAGAIVAGQDFALVPSATGSISGTTVADVDAEVHLVWQDHFLAAAGPDPTTGEFLFDGVAAGTYDVVLLVGGVEADRIEGVEVTADTDTGGLMLGLP